MDEFLAAERRWLDVERLPGYSPALNPVESLWSNVKGQELANRCGRDLGEMADAFINGDVPRPSPRDPAVLLPPPRGTYFFDSSVIVLCEIQ